MRSAAHDKLIASGWTRLLWPWHIFVPSEDRQDSVHIRELANKNDGWFSS